MDLRGNVSSFGCSNKSKRRDIGTSFLGWIGRVPKCVAVE